jgi:hypothetical protein
MAQSSETIPVPASAMPQFKQLASNFKAELQAAASMQPARFE